MKTIKHYRLEDQLGQGAFSKVFLAFHSISGTPFACKMVNRKSLDKRRTANLESEIAILQKCPSPHVISLVDLEMTPNNYYLFLEFCNGGDLQNLLELWGHLDERAARPAAF